MRKALFTGIAVLVFILNGCTATTNFQSAQPNTTLKINNDPAFTINETDNLTYATTSFGQFKFKASSEGSEPLYGLIPLKFNGGYLAADILFFAPAMFFNLREVFPFYEVDLEDRVLRYKLKEQDEWSIYSPTDAEAEHAKSFIGE